MDHFEGRYKERIQALLRAYNAARYVQDDDEPCQIEEGLFLGSLGAANNKSGLKRLNVTHVLTVAASLAPPHPSDFTYKVIEVADREETNLAQYFDECIDFIDEAKRSGGGVLVHCFVGRSRSVTVILAYLLKKRGMMLSEALQHVRRKRPQASPNAGFIKQLQNYEQSLRAKESPN
ncbi:dual specificity protein phosphatase 1-like isoform X2 [Silene latifolia]|uniref:dual specificity protein phosphatase 1-like isoform X2 n=1 Tax=Silene latifolia TaxID=37657 RepID=UPI003D770414